MNLPALFFALAVQVTPPPTPPAIYTPPPSPSPSAPASATPLPSESPAPSALTATPAALNLQPRQTQSVSIGNASGPVTASIDVPLATIAVDQNARTLTVTAGAQTGRATITVYDGTGASLQIPLRVALPAATIPATIALRVTGDPVDQAWLQKQLQQAVLKAVQLQQGVVPQSVQIGSYSLPPSLGPGASAGVPVPVHVAGGDRYLDADAQVSVTLENVALDPFAPPLLFYDDDPEKIVQNGVLYRAHVNPGAPARLYYYHQNTADARRLLVLLSAAGAQTSTVQLIDASAGPNIDVMSVGHAVSRDFLTYKPRNQGVVVDVTPGAPLIADDFQVMKPLDGAAGNIGIRIVSGGPVTVTVVAVPAQASAQDVAAFAAGPQLPGDGHHRTGIFNIAAYGTETIAYSTAGPDAQFQYGAASPPLADPPASTGHDYGEYGVMRTLTFEVENPSADPATVYLYERPMGGVVRSSFLVNGALVQVGCARVSNRYQIGPPFAAASGKSQIQVQTMTDGGSNYPLEVGLTTTPPEAVTPAITAADGCFPKPQSTSTPAPGATPPVPMPEPTGRARF